MNKKCNFDIGLNRKCKEITPCKYHNEPCPKWVRGGKEKIGDKSRVGIWNSNKKMYVFSPPIKLKSGEVLTIFLTSPKSKGRRTGKK